MSAQQRPTRIEPDVGIPELIQRLSDDSKRLAGDEVRLVKLEAKESVKQAGLGAMWMAIAFSAGVVALIALTLLVATLIGRWASGHMWLGAVITGVVELVIGAWLIKRGLSAAAEPSYSLEATRESITGTSDWVKSNR
ncbi:MAG: phage holin family protein [Gemmatimonadaceae bacterium]